LPADAVASRGIPLSWARRRIATDAVYSGGASRETLLKVADATRYNPEVEKAVAALTSA